MQYRPDQSELLEAFTAFFEDELLPTLDGPLHYRALVAANLVGILARESRSGVQSLHDARRAAELARRLDARDESLDQTQTWQVLMEITRAKLAIVRPGYDRWGSSTEQPQDG